MKGNKIRLISIVVSSALVFVVALVLACVDQASAQTPAEVTTRSASSPEHNLSPHISQQQVVSGNLSVSKYSNAAWGGAVVEHPISYTIWYGWSGDGPASNVQIVDQFPPEVTITDVKPQPTSQSGNTLTWHFDTLEFYGDIVVTGTVQSITPGTLITNTVTITGDVNDTDPEDNQDQLVVEAAVAAPDLWIWKWGLLEEMDQGLWDAEVGVETTFELLYINWSTIEAPNTTVMDTLPTDVEFVSAEPPVDSINGQELTWNVGTLGSFDVGEIIVRVRPVHTGTLVNTATITSTAGDREPSDNTDDFTFDVVPILPPRVLKPNMENATGDQPFIVGANPRFEGLAKAGSTVTLYEGDADGCWSDFADCNPTALVSTTADLDRGWVLTPTTMTETRVYSLYLRAELDGATSEPPFFYWTPLVVEVDPSWQQAGWDMDSFTIESGGQETQPGALGGTVGTTPDEPFTIKIRQKLWDSVPTSPTLRAQHDLKLVITEDYHDPYTMTLPVSEFQRVTETVTTGQVASDLASILGTWSYDMIYVHHGFGPGSRVEVWCRPVYYPDDPNELPLVGLVWTLCNEILVDPAGYVYDRNSTGVDYDWPAVPPSDALVTNATVTATVRTGDNSWARWEAEKTGQANPQVTDYTSPDGIKVPGYYAFYVPSGQYRVMAVAPNCAPYLSPILTVIDEPIFHNVGMRCTSEAQVGVKYDLFLPVLQR